MSHVVIRIERPYPSEEAFLQAEGWTLSRSSIILLHQGPLALGSVVRFELKLQNGTRLMRAEGTVARYQASSADGPSQMELRFRRFDAAARALIESAEALAALTAGDFPILDDLEALAQEGLGGREFLSATPPPVQVFPNRLSSRPPPNASPLRADAEARGDQAENSSHESVLPPASQRLDHLITEALSEPPPPVIEITETEIPASSALPELDASPSALPEVALKELGEPSASSDTSASSDASATPSLSPSTNFPTENTPAKPSAGSLFQPSAGKRESLLDKLRRRGK